MGMLRLSDTNFIVCYSRGDAAIGVCNIGYVFSSSNNSGNNKNDINNESMGITFSEAIIFNPKGGTDEISINVIDSNNLLICHLATDAGSCIIGILNGIAMNMTIEFDIQNGIYNFIDNRCDETDAIIIPKQTNNVNNENMLVLVCFVDLKSIDHFGVCQFGDIIVDSSKNGYKIVWQSDTTTKFNTQLSTDEVNLMYLKNDIVIVCYLVDREGPCKFGKILTQ